MSSKRMVLFANNRCLLSKSNLLTGIKCENQYNSINLNQNQKFEDVKDDFVDYKNLSEKNYSLNDWKKNDILKSENVMKKEGYKWHNKNVENCNKSTLSLHFSTYENLNENSNNTFESKMLQKCLPSLLAEFTDISSFGFRRQQENEKLMMPQIMHFKTTQKLLNINAIGRKVSSPKLLFTRNIRRRGPPADFHPPPKEADFLKDATTYSDVHSAILDPHSSLPYPAEQLQDYLHNKEKEQQRSVRSQEYKKGRKVIKLNFDHIPIEDQVVALFPGQGAQHLKMGEKVIDCPSSKALFDQANEILGYDLLKICMDGPKTKLDQTIYCQPAVFVASLAAYEKLKTEQTDLEDRLTDAAGFSVGEYAALVAGGVMKFEDALKVVKIRAEAMHECNQIVSAGMLTIRVNASSKLEEALKAACEDAMESDEVPVCEVANYLFQGVKVIGGTNRCLTFLESNAQRFKIQPIKRLAVSGAFHTRLMANAMEKVQHAFTGMQFEQSTCNIYSNYTGKIHSRKAGEIRKALIQQVAEPVKWEQIQQLLFRKHQDFKFPNFIEIGPGRQLGSMLVNISKKAYQAYTNYPC